MIRPDEGIDRLATATEVKTALATIDDEVECQLLVALVLAMRASEPTAFAPPVLIDAKDPTS